MRDAANTRRAPSDEGAAPSDGERPSACLTDDEVVELVGGRLRGARASAAHAHLDECTVCQSVVTGAVHGSSAERERAGDASWGATFRTGQVVAGRYRILRFVARGGMGEVYEAFDRDLEERVALKAVLSTACDSQNAVRRLKAEVQLAHRVSHANVCRIYDLGLHVFASTRGTMNFLTMEFVEGERLRERIERARVPLPEALDIARQLLHGLRAAHAAGILHRDFKSDNVMLRPMSGGRVSPVIMDFGLARAMDTDSARLTSGTNGLIGTPCYMAPEQLEGQPLTIASDIYSFGVVWFEMLASQLPFSPRAPFERLHRAPRKPSSVYRDIPEDVDRIVLGCLERTPEKRFRAVEEVLAELDALGDARARTSSVVSAPRFLFTRKTTAVALAAAMTGCAIGSALVLGSSRAASHRAVEAPPIPAAPRSAPPERDVARAAKPAEETARPPAAATTASRDETPPRLEAHGVRSKAKQAVPSASASREVEPALGGTGAEVNDPPARAEPAPAVAAPSTSAIAPRAEPAPDRQTQKSPPGQQAVPRAVAKPSDFGFLDPFKRR
jgi:serine/threonine protein kinase